MVADFSITHYKAKNLDMLKVITKPITKMIVQVKTKSFIMTNLVFLLIS